MAVVENYWQHAIKGIVWIGIARGRQKIDFLFFHFKVGEVCYNCIYLGVMNIKEGLRKVPFDKGQERTAMSQVLIDTDLKLNQFIKSFAEFSVYNNIKPKD